MAKRRALPMTSYIMLGLLSFGEELSGYEIRKRAQSMRFFYWSPAQSQVYSELERLRERGLVTLREVEQSGKPDKKLYRITPDGELELRTWLAQPAAATVVKHSAALKLYFGHMTTPDILVGMLDRFIEEAREMQGQLAIVQEFLADEPEQEYPSLATKWGYHYLEAEVAMAESMKARLLANAEKE